MKNEHILEILDRKTFGDLSSNELQIIGVHVSRCDACRQSFNAAKVSSVLLRADANESFATIPPFFATRVMANLREKQIAANPWAAIERMWKASKTLIGAMTLTVLVLIVLTFSVAKLNSAPEKAADAFDNYSTEMVILNEKTPTKEPTNEQIFQIVYGSDK